jgi:hypothetical protein
MRTRLFLLCGLIGACSDATDRASRDLLESTATVENPYGLQAAWNTGPTNPFSGPPHLRVDALQGGGAERKRGTLAYEHAVRIELAPEALPVRLRELREACAGDGDGDACTVLDVRTETDNGLTSGGIRMRLAPARVEPMLTLASKGGEVTSRNTHAEDLAEPVADAERQLSLLTTHRDRLTELMKQRGLPIDQLITVSKELASVQMQLDTAATQRANLRRRVDTELLTINLWVPADAYQAARSPVADAFRGFGSYMADATGGVVQFLAYLLPWLVVIVPAIFLLRLFWRWITRWLIRREARAAAP